MTSSSQQKSIFALNLVLDNCDAALAVLPNDVQPEPSSHNFSVLHKDFLAILSLLHASTTKVALTLNPASPEYTASIAPVTDTSNNISRLVHCLGMIHRRHGEALFKEIASAAQHIIAAVKSFVQSLLAIHNTTLDSFDGAAAGDYILRTGAVHEAIERERALSNNNYDAVRKVWQRDHDSLVDGLDEIQEMCKPSDNTQDLDDGWDDLGLGSNAKLSPLELQRTEKVSTIIKLSTLLHQRTIKKLLTPPKLPPIIRNDTNTLLDKLALSSPALLAASDELISTMYAPQSQEAVGEHLVSFNTVMTEIRSLVISLEAEQELEVGMSHLSLSDGPAKNKKTWFSTCFEQIELSRRTVSDTLKENI